MSGNAAIDQQSSRVRITIKKKGYPNGLFSFTGVVLPSHLVNEPRDEVVGINQTISIPVKRRFGRLGKVEVCIGESMYNILREDNFVGFLFLSWMTEMIFFAGI